VSGFLRTIRPYRRLVVWAAVVGGFCAVTDWPLEKLSGIDWQAHPLWAGVITGGLLLFAGYFGVEGYLEARDAERWNLVAGVAFKAIGLSAALLRDGMDQLIGADRDQRLRPQPLTPRLVTELRRAQLKAIDIPHDDRSGRLRRVATDPVWAALAVEAMDQLKWRHRDTLARWAPLMLANDKLSDDFTRLAQLNEMVSELQKPLRRRANIDERNECPIDDAGTVTAMIVERWNRVATRTVLLQEDFMRAAGDIGWVHEVARRHLTEEGRDELKRRDTIRTRRRWHRLGRRSLPSSARPRPSL
jgi:hypothetical protein